MCVEEEETKDVWRMNEYMMSNTRSGKEKKEKKKRKEQHVSSANGLYTTTAIKTQRGRK